MEFTQLGMGAVVALLILKEVFAFLKKGKPNGASGERSVEFWQQTIANTVTTSFNASLAPILHNNNEVLREIRDSLNQTNTNTVRVLERMKGLRDYDS